MMPIGEPICRGWGAEDPCGQSVQIGYYLCPYCSRKYTPSQRRRAQQYCDWNKKVWSEQTIMLRATVEGSP